MRGAIGLGGAGAKTGATGAKTGATGAKTGVAGAKAGDVAGASTGGAGAKAGEVAGAKTGDAVGACWMTGAVSIGVTTAGLSVLGSEERRVGKECRSRWSPY